MTGFTDAQLQARIEALDAALPVIKRLPGDQSSLLRRIEIAKMSLVEMRNVRPSQSVFRDVESALEQVGVSEPALMSMIGRARRQADPGF